MTESNVLRKIDSTGIRRESDFAVPVNGAQVPLPYLVVRSKKTILGSDNGKVQIVRIEWVVALFSRNRDLELEFKLLQALNGIEKLDVIPFPDGSPYQTTFKFTTYQTMK